MQKSTLFRKDWLYYHSLVLIAGLGIDAIICKTVACLPTIAFISFLFFFYNNWGGFTELRRYGGIPNLITSLRLVTLFLIPFIKESLLIAVITTMVVLLDGLDGYVARKLNQTTKFGEHLDMETDAFFCLLISLVIFNDNKELAWVLIGGSLRYLYKIITTLIPKENFVETKKKYARFLAGCYFISIVMYFFVGNPLNKYVIGLGNILVFFSFAVSFYEFFKFDKAI